MIDLSIWENKHFKAVKEKNNEGESMHPENKTDYLGSKMKTMWHGPYLWEMMENKERALTRYPASSATQPAGGLSVICTGSWQPSFQTHLCWGY